MCVDDKKKERFGAQKGCAAVLIGLVLMLASCLLACQPERLSDRSLFDEAEQAYRQGHYDRAVELYEAFLKGSPDPQLARLAERRVLSIEREIETVMGNRAGPRPIYLRPVLDDVPTGPAMPSLVEQGGD